MDEIITEENISPIQEPPKLLTEELKLGDSLSATVVKGPGTESPGETIDIPPAPPIALTPWQITLQAFPEQLKQKIVQECQQSNFDVGSYLSKLIIGMLQVYQSKTCPYCFREKALKTAVLEQSTLKSRLELEKFRKNEKKKFRDQRRAAKRARIRNRA